MYNYNKICSTKEGAIDLFKFLAIAFESLPSKKINQGFGSRSTKTVTENKECGACVGWWIAYWLNIPDHSLKSLMCFMHGRELFFHAMKLIGYAEDKAILMLGLEAGLTSKELLHLTPFGAKAWKFKPSEVFNNLIKTINLNEDLKEGV